ncbi:lutropin-choriogonadotropic hormone receptor-like isoform X3 [Betta splendens]|uniref:Lutropin-choriogonadotropic hormone receptor-like isoform X3 n=1 Tax=Betta splendens TaxID=158456 RepID=A0A6P7P025_BETSP|nr:lutropin-choriogonadotropic hormone receptor-like isoform X3 [Betta splendens]
MEAALKLLVAVMFVEVTVPLDHCPRLCQCDWMTQSVWCSGIDAVPALHPSTQEVSICDDDTLQYLERHSFHHLPRLTHIQLNGLKALSHIDPEAFKELPNLKYLGIINTGLRTFPELYYIQSRQEDFILEIVENPFIRVIPANSFTGISDGALTVMLNSNGVKEIQSHAFNGSQLEEVFLHRNVELEFIHDLAFYGVVRGPTHIPSEPLICNSTWTASETLQDSLTAQGVTREEANPHPAEALRLAAAHSGHCNEPWCLPDPSDGLSPVEPFTEGFDLALCDDLQARGRGPSCSPLPDALNPCEDVMSRGFLRVLVWVVGLFAVSANLLVLLVLLTSQQRLSVTRFLMGHLAFADFCMGTYLLLIASVDLYTRSQYSHYAIAWQTGSGCNLAGLLSVFASELSVYTLTLISLQRWHAILCAMRPDRKMRLRHAAALMLAGWLLCWLLALLPLVGVSSYQKVSICLPMDTDTSASRAYVVFILMVNVVAFMVVCLCYLHIYCMVHNPRHQSSSCDTSMAKRIAVLIFTNFLCLAPICFYGLSAALHQPLMTITDSKVLLVLFYPLNSCAHPFFYAFLTKAFHLDVLMLLSRMGLCQRQAQLYRSQHVSTTPHMCSVTMSVLSSKTLSRCLR